METDTERRIYIHIAADSDLSLPRLRQSYLDARSFFEKFFPDYAEVDMFCESWMLCPVLNELLPASSNILAFQRSFEIDKVDHDDKRFLRWIYGRGDIQPTDLPEGTLLQRKTKSHLLRGGKVGWAFGKLAHDPFIA